MGPHKRRNAAYQLREEEGQASPIEVMIIHMNRSIRGWCVYHRCHNAKKVFSRVDHEVWRILFQWAKRTFPKRGRRRLVSELFNGGAPWRFGLASTPSGEPRWLMKAAETQICRHVLVKAEASFFNGDWSYWGKRQGKYPSIPGRVARMLKRQNGRCPVCNEHITTQRRVLTTVDDSVSWKRDMLIHEHCNNKLPTNAVTKNPFVTVVSSPGIERCMPGLKAPYVREDKGAYQEIGRTGWFTPPRFATTHNYE